MFTKTIAVALLVSGGYWHGPEPARKYTLQNDGMTAEDVFMPSISRFYWLQWPNVRQKVILPQWWRPGDPLPKFKVPPEVTSKYGDVYVDRSVSDDSVPEPMPVFNDRAIGNVDRFGTVLH